MFSFALILEISSFFCEMEKIDGNEVVWNIIASPKCYEVAASLSLKNKNG